MIQTSVHKRDIGIEPRLYPGATVARSGKEDCDGSRIIAAMEALCDLGGGCAGQLKRPLVQTRQTQAGSVRLMGGFLGAPGGHELRILSPVSKRAVLPPGIPSRLFLPR